ncbi:MAG: hypothetical protein QHJ73_15865, partial [Armatimonadota bacterium]|nr:hypothetical protein [Armatimonadota bacterium]
MHPTLVILSAKRRSIANKLRPLPVELAVSLPVLAAMLALFFYGGYRFFFVLFRFLRDTPPFGTMLTERLLAVVFLAFFSMLVFSNVVTSLTTLYLSEELEFLFSHPIPFNNTFFARFWESVVYSSSAFVVLGLPIFLAYGHVYEAPGGFYGVVFLYYLPFLIVPAALGTLVTVLLARFFPARKTRTAFLVLLALILAAMAGLAYFIGHGSLSQLEASASVGQILDTLRLTQLPYLPNYWMARGIIAAASRDFSTTAFFFLVLLSAALMGLQLCAWVAAALYYPGWTRTRESEESVTRRVIFPFFDWLEVLLRPLPRPTRALLLKDLRSFWRDPAQWAQLLLLFGLMVIYISNLRNAPVNTAERFWQSVLSFFNMGATCFVMATITSRFIFPLWSLEGRQFWVVGLAPLSRRRLLWQKWVGCVFGVLLLGEAVMMYSNYMLRVPNLMLALSGATVAFTSVGLVSLALGLGAVFPNFREDNTARIANGAGGTLNVVVSLLYVGVNVAVQTYPVHALLAGKAPNLEA